MTARAMAVLYALQVERLTPQQLLASDWQADCLVLVMPGGADLPYTRLLNGAGNRIIRGQRHTLLALQRARARYQAKCVPLGAS